MTEHDHDHDEDSYYTCPMHPQVVREQTGDCPVCGMSLVLKKRTEGGGEIGLVEISPPIVQTIGVTSERAQRRNLVKTVRTNGRVAFDEKTVKEISAWVPGRMVCGARTVHQSPWPNSCRHSLPPPETARAKPRAPSRGAAPRASPEPSEPPCRETCQGSGVGDSDPEAGCPSLS